MTYAISMPHGFTPSDRGRPSRRASSRPAFRAAALALCALAGAFVLDVRPTAAPPVDEAPAVASKAVVAAKAAAAPNTYFALLDPAPCLGAAPLSFAQSVPLGSTFQPIASAPPAAVAEAEDILRVPMPAPAAPLAEAEPVLPMPAGSQFVEGVPVPTPRPPGFRSAARQGAFHRSGRQLAQQNTTIVPATAPPDNRNFLEKLFGMAQPSGPVLGYAAPEDGFFGRARSIASSPGLAYDRWTAVYDIAAHTVYMPDGARLEAHSGLGDRLDDPRHVHERNRGATPPNVYDLEPRAQLFHGVPALRLNPVGSGGSFGRTGLLAHTYMLGPHGDSNGCVSFRNYDAFLQAFQNGQVKRLVVVARLN